MPSVYSGIVKAEQMEDNLMAESEQLVSSAMENPQMIMDIIEENQSGITSDEDAQNVIQKDVSLSNVVDNGQSSAVLFEADSTVEDLSPDKLFDECTQTSSQEFGISLSQIPLDIEPVMDNSTRTTAEEDKVNVRSRKRERKQTYQPRIEQEQSDFEFIEVRIPVKAPSVEKDKVSIRCPMGTSGKNERKSRSRRNRSFDKENLSPNPKKNSGHVNGMLHETSRQMFNAANWIMQEADCFSSDTLSDEDIEFDELQAMKCESKEYHETDLATALGIDPSSRSQEKIESRKLSIRQKMRSGRTVHFTLEEEFDVHERAEEYLSQLVPDSSYYRLPSPCPWDKDGLYGRNVSESEDPLSPERKRKRKSYDNIKCYVTHQNSQSRNYLTCRQDNSRMLPEGTRLLKPPNKLVELVAQVINDSPDGMLQVQQVYVALQNRFPYFRFMDKSSITSWRSSIRHALYQKWFRKVSFTTDLISCRGCYWSINRRHTPKEWTMPSQHSQLDAHFARINLYNNAETARQMETVVMTYADPETSVAVESILPDLPSVCLKSEDRTSHGEEEAVHSNLLGIFTDDSHLADIENVESESALSPVDPLLFKAKNRHSSTDYQNQKGKEHGSPVRDMDPTLTLMAPPAIQPHYTSGMINISSPKTSFDHSGYMDLYQTGRSGFQNSVDWHHKTSEEVAYENNWNLAWEEYHNSLMAYQQPVLPAVYMPYIQCVDYTEHSQLYQPMYGKHLEDQW